MRYYFPNCKYVKTIVLVFLILDLFCLNGSCFYQNFQLFFSFKCRWEGNHIAQLKKPGLPSGNPWLLENSKTQSRDAGAAPARSHSFLSPRAHQTGTSTVRQQRPTKATNHPWLLGALVDAWRQELVSAGGWGEPGRIKKDKNPLVRRSEGWGRFEEQSIDTACAENTQTALHTLWSAGSNHLLQRN